MSSLKVAFLWIVVFFATPSISQDLYPYEAFYNHWDIEGFSKQFGRAFDEEGILIQKKEYHALTICFYGIINYHEFEKTGDSLYYKRVINQYKYFQDTTRLMYFDDNESVGLPYHFNFKQMRAPWFSGMTQGTGISFLLRYYDMTGDESAKLLAKKLARFMLKDEKEGGTISKTKEGNTWIEEYPNSGGSRSVLNGFVNGFVGLYEYLLFYPEDEVAKRIHDECYDAIFASLIYYDKPNWTAYNRNGGNVTTGYMRYQLSEFDHLYNLYKDERFRDEMKIWSKFAVDRIDKEIKFYKHPQYQYALRIKMDPDKKEYLYMDTSAFSASLTNVYPEELSMKRKKTKLVEYKWEEKTYYAEFELDIDFPEKKTVVSCFLDGNEVEVNAKFLGRKLVVQSQNGFDRVKVKLKKKLKYGHGVEGVYVYDYQNYEMPLFLFVDVPERMILDKGDGIQFDYKGFNLTNARVFYRYAPNAPSLASAKYSIHQVFPLDSKSFEAKEMGVYEFFVSYEVTHPVSGFYEIKPTRR